MKYDRLITFGCSNTYGQGLPDNTETNGDVKPNCSRYSWPFILGNLLEIKNVLNLAVPGASNKKIAKDILDFKFAPQDLVVVGWSFIERDCVFLSNENDYFSLGVNYRCKKNKIWQRNFFNYSDRVVETGMFSSLGARVIKETAGKYFGFFCCISNFYFDSDIESYEPIYNLDYPQILETYGTAADNFHPNEKSHQEIAKKIRDLLNG